MDEGMWRKGHNGPLYTDIQASLHFSTSTFNRNIPGHSAHLATLHELLEE